MRGVDQHAPVRDGGGGGPSSRVVLATRWVLAALLLSSLLIWLSACGQEEEESIGLGERVIPLGQPVPKGGGRFQVGKPYEIAGVRYHPKEDPAYDRTGVASWYGELFHGRYTANGEIYDMDRLSAAHPTLPLPIYAHVTNLKNGRTIIVRVNDRGPFRDGRIIDLSRRSADILGFRREGTANVRVRYLRRAPLNGDDSYERQYLADRKNGRNHLASRSGAELPPLPDRPERPAMAAALATPKPARSRPPVPVRTAMVPEPQSTQETAKSLPPHLLAPVDGPAIQAGSFKSRDNAERARAALSEIAPVDVSEVDVGGEIFYRVLVGPFSDGIEAAAAFPLVTDAGYRGAKIVLRN